MCKIASRTTAPLVLGSVLGSALGSVLGSPARALIALAILPLLSAACTSAPARNCVLATVETTPVASLDDAADDPALWINPADPAQSRVLGTDKRAGLAVYDLSGAKLQFLPVGRVNNVDVRSGLTLAGKNLTIAAATQRDDKTIVLWSIDATGTLAPLAAIPTTLAEPYGVCLSWAGPTPNGRLWAFANDKTGRIEQYELKDNAGTLSSTLVRTLQLATQPEGLVADEPQGFLFAGEEGRGVWRFPLDPAAGNAPTLIADIKPKGHLTPDVEGLAVVTTGPDNQGFLIVSSQGSNEFALYDRRPPHRFVTLFSITDSPSIDGVQETDGLEATTTPLGPTFPFGVLIVQDGDNNGLPQNFKLIPWESIARLLPN
jgi:3-phytase